MEIYSLVQSQNYTDGTNASVISSHRKYEDAQRALHDYVHSEDLQGIIELEDDEIDSCFVTGNCWSHDDDCGYILEYYICTNELD